MKKHLAILAFQIGVNVIGLPNYYKHYLGKIGSDKNEKSLYHK